MIPPKRKSRLLCWCTTELTAPLFLFTPLFLLPFSSTSLPLLFTFHCFLCSPSSSFCSSRGQGLAPVTQMYLTLRVTLPPIVISSLEAVPENATEWTELMEWSGCVLTPNLFINAVTGSCSGCLRHFPLQMSDSNALWCTASFSLQNFRFWWWRKSSDTCVLRFLGNEDESQPNASSVLREWARGRGEGKKPKPPHTSKPLKPFLSQRQAYWINKKKKNRSIDTQLRNSLPHISSVFIFKLFYDTTHLETMNCHPLFLQPSISALSYHSLFSFIQRD